MHACIAAGLNEDPQIEARAVTLQDPEQGLPEALLEDTDVLLWWGHAAHGDVRDETVDRVQARVLQGMGCWCCTLPLLQDLQAPDGYHLFAEVARGRRA